MLVSHCLSFSAAAQSRNVNYGTLRWRAGSELPRAQDIGRVTALQRDVRRSTGGPFLPHSPRWLTHTSANCSAVANDSAVDGEAEPLGLIGVRFVKARGYEVLHAEDALDRRAASADLDLSGALLQIRFDVVYLSLRQVQGPHGFR